jgi:hypothetical protein
MIKEFDYNFKKYSTAFAIKMNSLLYYIQLER